MSGSGSNIRHPTRRIPDREWMRLNDEIEELYLKRKPPMTLKQLRLHFQAQYGFTATQKQWKDFLTKSNLKRNLDRPVAAIILYLLIEAEEANVERRVSYNNQPKERRDIEKYISKSNGIATPEDLLRSLPDRTEWATRGVSYHDKTILPAHSGNTTAIPTGAGLYVVASQPPPNNPPLLPQFQNQVGDGLLSETFYTSSHPSDDPHIDHGPLAMGRRYHNLPEQSVWCRPIDQHTSENDGPPQLNGPPPAIPYQHPSPPEDGTETDAMFEELLHDGSLGFDELYAPFDNVPAFRAIGQSPLAILNGLVSVTPFNLSPETDIATAIDRVLGHYGDIHNSPSKSFTRFCLEGCIYDGQGRSEEANEALRNAVENFQVLMDDSEASFTWSLPVLNRISFLLESYGQKEIKTRVFERLKNELVPSSHDRWWVLLHTLDFLLDTARWDDDKASSNIAKSQRIYETAVEVAGKDSPLALSAHYNAAWVLLEAGQCLQALEILNTERAKCETTFTIYAIECITWIATQARTHFRLGERDTAIAMMEEVVLQRAEKAYGKEHPFYWEVRYRVGLFLLQDAASGSRPQIAPRAWAKGEELLKETWLWRGTYLGEANPQTRAVYTQLKRYLEQQGKTHVAENLWRWYHSQRANGIMAA